MAKCKEPSDGGERRKSARSSGRAGAKRAGPSASPGPGRPSSLIDTRVIYCGDNLEQLARLPDACVDLIYIDPPFNSNRNYEVFWGETKEKRSFEDRHASTQAYIDYMRPRCVQLARVLKKTGSFYYHCDWHASHYVKVMLDQIFGENNLLNEIVWRRTNSRTESHQWPRLHDCVFLYTGGGQRWTFHPTMVEGEIAKQPHTLITGVDGEKYNSKDLTGPGVTKTGESGQPWHGYNPKTFGRHWGYSHATMDEWDRAGRIHWPKKKGAAGGFPRLLDDTPFEPKARAVQIGSVWTDIDRINQSAKERLGYPTQKPLALLERIIRASSNPNDIVLDAFCGCGTALVAAQNLGRQWVGIDISPTACRVMAKRLKDVCGMRESEPGHRAKDANSFIVRDLPWTIDKLRAIPHFEFENWAVIALGGVPNKVQVGDMGIDGRIFPVGTKPADAATRKGETASMFAGDWFPIQVKQSERVGRPDIDAFEAVMEREDRSRGFFVAFSYTADAEAEAVAFWKRTRRKITLITVREILDELHVQRL
ncbi:MAG: restriction endonuclease [Phycisphaerales bacterium]|nr:restriction endonuclease [Phycisphaerales bacterium]